MVLNSPERKLNRGTTMINFVTHFFLIYINDLPNLPSIGRKILLYGDNTIIIVTSPSIVNVETKIDNILWDINSWFKVNQLILNYSKTLQFQKKIAWIMI